MKKNIPMNRWISLDSLTSDQLQAVIEGPVSCEWHLGFQNGRELMEVKITPTPKSV